MSRYIDMLENSTHDQILKVLLPSHQVEAIKDEVEVFMSRKHRVKHSVLRAVLFWSITAVKIFNGPEAIPNEAYLRKTLETFKKEKINDSASALNYMQKLSEVRKKHINKSSIKPKNPEWVDDYKKELENWG